MSRQTGNDGAAGRRSEMTGQSSLTLSVLQAIELFRVKQSAEWTQDELAAFRARLKQSPGLVAPLGGQSEVDRRLAEVAAAQSAASQEPAARDASTVTAAALPPPARAKILWRTVEATVFLALLGGACGWFYMLWPKAEREPESAALDKTTRAAAPLAKSAPAQPLDRADEPAPVEPDGADKTDDHTWQGWTIAASRGAQWKLMDDWDLTDPSNPQPARLLTIEGGPVSLTRRSKIAAESKFLELNVRPLHAASRPGHIVVSVDDAPLADTTIGSGKTKWPLYVSLDQWAGKDVSLRVEFVPDQPGQKLAWWDLALVATQRHEPRGESSLAEGLAAKEPKDRLLAVKMAGLGRDLFALPALAEALRDRDSRVRQAAVAALLRFDNSRARDALRAALENDGDAALRTVIAASFGQRPENGDVPSLVKALRDPNAGLRQAAARTLGRLPDESVTELLVQMLGDSDPAVRIAAAGGLMPRRGEAVAHAMLQVLTRDSDMALKNHALSYFKSHPTLRVIAPLTALLNSDNQALRRQVVQTLIAIKEPGSTKVLATALGDSSPAVRQMAAVGLSGRKDAVADEVLLAALGGEFDDTVKRHAATHFQQFPNRRAIQPLAAALSAKDESLRRQAVQALGRIPEEAAIEALGIALKDPAASVRRAATMALKQSRHPKAAVVLQQSRAAK